MYYTVKKAGKDVAKRDRQYYGIMCAIYHMHIIHIRCENVIYIEMNALHKHGFI